MTPQEKMMIEGVAERLRAHTLTSKDPQAEQLISQSIATQPDLQCSSRTCQSLRLGRNRQNTQRVM